MRQAISAMRLDCAETRTMWGPCASFGKGEILWSGLAGALSDLWAVIDNPIYATWRRNRDRVVARGNRGSKMRPSGSLFEILTLRAGGNEAKAAHFFGGCFGFVDTVVQTVERCR